MAPRKKRVPTATQPTSSGETAASSEAAASGGGAFVQRKRQTTDKDGAVSSMEAIEVDDEEDEEKAPAPTSQLPAPGFDDLFPAVDDATEEDEVAAHEEELLAEMSAMAKNATTEEFPQNEKRIPLQYKYVQDRFFVRECYDEFYKLVKAALQPRPNGYELGVTVSGTLGIGKSMFLVYFFLRRIKEDDFKDGTVTFASYSAVSDLKEVAVARVSSDGEGSFSFERLVENVPNMVSFVKRAEAEARSKGRPCICLCDGPPPYEPQMVEYLVCTSPNESWIKNTRKLDTQTNLFMPLWTLKELLTAAVALQLNVPSAWNPNPLSLTVTEQLFAVFGGVARACLCLKPAYLAAQRKQLEEPIEQALNATKIKRLFEAKKNPQTHHWICHYMPSKDRLSHTPQLASKYVERLLLEAVVKIEYNERDKLSWWLGTQSLLRSTAGVLFEWKAHTVLQKGKTLRARRFDPVADGNEQRIVEFVIESTRDLCEYGNEFSLDTLGDGPYFIPKSKNATAIDAFYCFRDKSVKSRWVASGVSASGGGGGSADSTGAGDPRSVGKGDRGGSVGAYGSGVDSRHKSVTGRTGATRVKGATGAISIRGQSGETNAPEYKALLFQMTVSLDHPEKTSGLERVLTQLALLDLENNSCKPVALVFVVPAKDANVSAASFARQKIDVDIASANMSPDDSVLTIHGVGEVRAAELSGKKDDEEKETTTTKKKVGNEDDDKKMEMGVNAANEGGAAASEDVNAKAGATGLTRGGVFTVGELQAAVDKGLWPQHRKRLEAHLARSKHGKKLLELLNTIPQYVCEL